MIDLNNIKEQFKKHFGVMRTQELTKLGLTSRMILRLVDEKIILKIKTGYYELADDSVPDEVIIAKVFPKAVIYLESALLHYGFTDRIPDRWQIAVDKNISKAQFEIDYPPLKPFYIENKLMGIGVVTYKINGVDIKIYDKERTICDVLKYANKLDKEVFNNAIQNYIQDKQKNIPKLIEYAKKLRLLKKVNIYLGVWL